MISSYVLTSRAFLRLVLAAVLAAVVVAPAAPSWAASQSVAPLAACASGDPALSIDDLSGITAPCAAARGSLDIETLYFQNASSVGGTALAAYPLFRLRTGIASRVEAVVDTPSQIAQSGPRGTGLYPTTHAGYGANYTFLSGQFAAASVGLEMVPPNSRFATTQTQPKYVVDLSAGYRVNARAVVSAIATGASSRSVGFARIAPSLTVRTAYDLSPVTQISTDLGTRVVARGTVAQSFSDIAINERLRKNLRFAVGLGTTFNPVSDAKAHYLASGFDFKL